MSLSSLLEQNIQDFIVAHEHDDTRKLILKHKEIHGVSTKLVAEQIEGRKKAKVKLPGFYSSKGIVYPPSVNLEQCSSQATAIFKSKIPSGKSIADLTGGFGVDSYYFSKMFEKVFYVEPDQNLYEIVKNNHDALSASNITHYCCSAEEFLADASKQFDICYLDPSRRTGVHRRAVRFEDCEPNVNSILTKIFDRCGQVLIKASPLLDIQDALVTLPLTKRVFVVAVDNACKELLFEVSNHNNKPETILEAINLSHNGNVLSSFNFVLSEELNSAVSFSDPLRYIYEPSASILKAGAFRLVSSRFSIDKLSANTHYYTSQNLLPDFPGRAFEIIELIRPDAKEVAKLLPDGKANVTTRNYPLTPDQLKKKLKLTDGGEKYLLGFSGVSKKYLAVAHRIY